jgi:hypothetical protein
MAKLLGVSQADVSQMLHGYFHQFSEEWLLRFLVALLTEMFGSHGAASVQFRRTSESKQLTNFSTGKYQGVFHKD